MTVSLRCLAVLLPFCLAATNSIVAQFDPQAGLIHPYTKGASVSVSSSTPGSYSNAIIDGDKASFWQSGGVLPAGFFTRPDLNILLGLGGTSASSNSGGLVDSVITDGNVYSALMIPMSNAKAWVEFELADSTAFRSLSFKGSVAADSINIWIYRSSTDSVLIGSFYKADNFSIRRFSLMDTITKIRLESDTTFLISDVGALSEQPTEYALIDLGAPYPIGWLETKHYSGQDVASSRILLSQDSIHWTEVAQLNPLATSMIIHRLPNEIIARYIKLEHTMFEANYFKAEIWEISAYDKYGKFGAMPPVSANSNSLSSMLGVNGIWGWGYGTYSDILLQGQGPSRFNSLSRHARNYHNLNWDIVDPDDPVDFNGMPGSLAQWWLDWDREYLAWDTAGLDVFVSLQFTNQNQPESSWDNPFQAAYNYGFSFAQHFGPSTGNGLVKRIEVGNEPWDYSPGFYRQVLQGMAEGIKAADASMEVFPCALQAVDSAAELGIYKNFAGLRMTDAVRPYIDGFNGHYYSYYNDSNGTRRATYPENYRSSMRGILNDLRFRDANFPNNKFFVSEWGWDSDGAGEPCTHAECVSEQAQAIYGIRYALMMSRLGVDDMTWFFYANDASPSSLYTRSGLTGSANTAFSEKQSFIAFEALLYHMGEMHFLDTLAENDDYWAYLFGDTTGQAKYLIAWRPVDATDSTFINALVPSNFAADSAWTLSGLSSTGNPTNVPTYSAGNLNLSLSAVPLLIKLQSNTLNNSPKSALSNVHLYPNPTHRYVNLSGFETINGPIVLKDCLGRTHRRWLSANAQLDLKNIPAGIYFLSWKEKEICVLKALHKLD